MGKIINKIYSIITEAKKPVDPKLIAWIEKRYGPWDERDFISQDGDTYFKYEKTSEGGGISHTIITLPSFGDLIKQLKDSRDAANDLIRGESVRDDEVLRDIYTQQRETYNTFRTHLRKEYPAFYSQLKGQLTEEELEEMSTTGGGAGSASSAGGTGMQYATPYAFKRVKKKKVKESHTDAENKKLKVISKELKAASKMHKGQAKKIDKIVKEYKSNSKYPNFDLNKNIKYQEGSISSGMWRYTGTEQGGKGVYRNLNNGQILGFDRSDFDVFKNNLSSHFDIHETLSENFNSYGYKLVPKNKAGNYVQKGSKLDVKQLFEDTKEYQDSRIAAFDAIEQEMNDIYKMLSNAKNETSDFYNDNPSSYTVVKPTDLVLDYIKDIKDLLKGE